MQEPHDAWVDRRYALAAGLLAPLAIALGVLARVHPAFPLDGAAMGWAQGLGEGYAPAASLTNEQYTLIEFATLVVGSVVAARRDLELALIFVLAAAIRPLLISLKAVVDRPRPSGDFAIFDTVYDSSFPSGHVMTVVLAFGIWAALAPAILPRRLVWPARGAAVALIGTFALSRMWAGVHWLSDVYGAFVWGGLAIALLLAARPALRRLCAASLRIWHEHAGQRVPALQPSITAAEGAERAGRPRS